MKKIGILNLGINNIKSINNACKIIGSAYVINKRSDFINNTDVIVLPGNGNFQAGIKMIKDLKIYVAGKNLAGNIPTRFLLGFAVPRPPAETVHENMTFFKKQ